MDTVKELGESFLAPLHRHFINLMCLDSGNDAKRQHNGQPAIYNFSAFVVEINHRWFGITAGHIFRDLKKAVDGGARLSDWQIDDSTVSHNPQLPYPIALDRDKDVFWLYDDFPGMDYAYFEIDALARLALSKEGIMAIPEHIWNAEDNEKYSIWLLVGTPHELSQLAYGTKLGKVHATVRLIPVAPEDYPYEKPRFQRLYARVDFESVVDGGKCFDIGGMSGGPVFGIPLSVESCNYDYRLIGIQSAWDADGKGHTALCAAQPFLRSIAQQLHG